MAEYKNDSKSYTGILMISGDEPGVVRECADGVVDEIAESSHGTDTLVIEASGAAGGTAATVRLTCSPRDWHGVRRVADLAKARQHWLHPCTVIRWLNPYEVEEAVNG